MTRSTTSVVARRWSHLMARNSMGVAPHGPATRAWSRAPRPATQWGSLLGRDRPLARDSMVVVPPGLQLGVGSSPAPGLAAGIPTPGTATPSEHIHLPAHRMEK
jgi:hypothetical protein